MSFSSLHPPNSIVVMIDYSSSCRFASFVKIVVAIANRKTTGFLNISSNRSSAHVVEAGAVVFLPEVLDVAMGFVGDILLDKGAVALGVLK